jgi:hypothetical protein
VLGSESQPAAAAATGEPREVAPVDLLRTAGAPVLKRLVPAAVALVVLVVVLVLLLR